MKLSVMSQSNTNENENQVFNAKESFIGDVQRNLRLFVNLPHIYIRARLDKNDFCATVEGYIKKLDQSLI